MHKKKFLSILLTFALVLGLLPWTVLPARADAPKVAKIGTTEYASVQDAIDEATLGQTVQLIADVVTVSTITVSSGKSVTLDLNDHGIRANTDFDDSRRFRVITVNSGAALTLTDNAASKTTRYITLGNLYGGKYGTAVSELKPAGDEGKDYLAVTGGYITGGMAYGNSSSDGGGAVYVDGNGTFTMNGGTLAGNLAVSGNGGGVCIMNNGTFTMGGGTIAGNTAWLSGGGVYVNENGTFTMSGGAEISGNKADSNGGGVYLGYCACSMEGGKISGNTAVSDGGGVYANGNGGHPCRFTMSGDAEISGNIGRGGGVYVSTNTTFAMSGNAKVSGNTSTSNGGGVLVDGTGALLTMSGNAEISENAPANNSDGGGVFIVNNGAFTMDGGTISGNTAYGGGGVGLYHGTFTMNGGSISGNNVTFRGGGVYVVGGMDRTFQVSGGATVTGNKLGGAFENGVLTGGTANNVYLDTNMTITVTGALTGELGVSMQPPSVFARADGTAYASGLTVSDAACFTSDKDDYMVVLDALGALLVENSENGLRSALPRAGSASYIKLSKDVKTTSMLTVAEGNPVTLDLNGHTIDRGLAGKPAEPDGCVIEVSGNLTLQDTSAGKTGKITGGSSSNHGGVYVYNNAVFTMTGGTICGNTAANGGGVYVDMTAKFTMTGGTICGNTAGSDGGGVFVEGAAFKVTDGAIRGNNANGNGGGVYCHNCGSFTVGGSAFISGNVKGGAKDENGLYTGGAPNNAYLITNDSGSGTYKTTISVNPDVPLTEGARIGVTAVYAPGAFTNGPSREGMAANFTSDDAAYAVALTDDGNAELVVYVPVESVTPGKTSLLLAVGGSGTLTATVQPENATFKSVTWSSDKESVATVDASGKVTAVSAGTATITAAADGKTATCTVTVSSKKAQTPVLPAAGSFTGSKSVTITCATDGATIYYTTDGSEPTTASTKYTAAFTISATTTVKAIAVCDGMPDSEPASATYTRVTSGGGSSGSGSGSTTAPSKTTETKNADGTTTTGTSSTTTKTNSDGSKTETIKETATTKARDGSKTETSGTIETTTKANGDGTTTAKTKATETETKKGADGKTTGTNEKKTETTKTLDKSGNGTVEAKTTETVKDASGKVTETIVIEKKGTVETAADGVKTTTTTNTAVTTDAATGEITTVVTTEKEIEAADGSTGTVTTDENGKTLAAEAAVSEKAVTDAAAKGEAVTLPVEVKAASSRGEAAPVEVTLPETVSAEHPATVEIPVENLTSGTVAVIVKPDGTEEIVKTSTNGENGVVLTLDGSATIKIVDNTKTFDDVNGSEWYANTVAWAASHEIMNGMGNGNFDADADTTQGMMEQILYNIDGGERAEPAEGESWWTAADNWAANGVTEGLGEAHDPSAPATRETDILMMYNYAKSKGYDVSARADLSRFSDAGGVSDYAKDAMAWAVAVGLISGSTDANGNVVLDAQGIATRAQVSAIAERFCEKVAK